MSSLDTTKGLLLARAFHLAGHKVIGCGIYSRYSDLLNPGQYSEAVSEYIRLPDPLSFGGKERYADNLCYLITAHRIDMWVCVSGSKTALYDAFSKSMIEAHTPCKVLQFPLKIVRQMDSKWDFIKFAKSLNLDVPETMYITSHIEAVSFFAAKLHTSVGGKLREEVKSKTKYVLRTTQADELSGERQTDLYPLGTLEETRHSLKRLDISENKPWIIQEYIPGLEYRTHSLIINGDVRAFAAAETSGMPLHFQALPPYTPAHAHMLSFTKTIAAALKQQSASNGQLSFDFILRNEHHIQRDRTNSNQQQTKPPAKPPNPEKARQRRVAPGPTQKPVIDGATPMEVEEDAINLVPINCSPRTDTAIVLFSPDLLHLADAYLSPILPVPTSNAQMTDEGESEKISCPNRFASPDGYYWIGSDLITLVVVPFIKYLTFRLTFAQFVGNIREFLRHVIFWKDATWEIWDPVPWWWGYHVFWPAVLAECFLRDERWGKINVATCQIDTSC